MKVAVPSWRPDVHGKADIVEEVVRIIGVERVPATPFDARRERRASRCSPPMQVRTRKAKRALAARGLVEAVTWSFISKPQAELFGGGKAELALANPIAADLSDMRPSLIPGLVAAAQKNADRGFPDVALFEVGQIFKGDRAGGSVHRRDRRAPRARQGVRHRPPLVEPGQAEVDAFDAKADALAVLDRRRRAGAGAAGRAGRAGLVPSRAAPARSRSGRRTCSAISASCIRARSKRSTPKGRWSPSR